MTKYSCQKCEFASLVERSALVHLKDDHPEIDNEKWTVREAREAFLNVTE